MDIFVFSYERGAYLANFLDSVRRVGWHGSVTIMDDGSTERRTLQVLERAERDGFGVVRQPHGSGGLRGGLRENMQAALELAAGPAVLFAQDDMQIVRNISAGEEEKISALLDDVRNSPLLFPVFHLRNWKASRRAKNFDFDARLRMPVRSLFHPLTGFSDVAVFSPERLRAAGLIYRYEESGTSTLAYSLFGPMVSYPYPFLAFVPSPVVPRLGRRNRLRHPTRRVTPARIDDMTDGDVERLLSHGPAEVPFADDWLTVRSRTRRWSLRRTGWVG